jgi:hypothetical protein
VNSQALNCSGELVEIEVIARRVFRLGLSFACRRWHRSLRNPLCIVHNGGLLFRRRVRARESTTGSHQLRLCQPIRKRFFQIGVAQYIES